MPIGRAKDRVLPCQPGMPDTRRAGGIRLSISIEPRSFRFCYRPNSGHDSDTANNGWRFFRVNLVGRSAAQNGERVRVAPRGLTLRVLPPALTRAPSDRAAPAAQPSSAADPPGRRLASGLICRAVRCIQASSPYGRRRRIVQDQASGLEDRMPILPHVPFAKNRRAIFLLITRESKTLPAEVC